MDPTRSRRKPFLKLHRVALLAFSSALFFLATLVLLGIVGKLGFEVVQGKKDPHRFAFGPYGVQPLLDEHRLFDVGVSVFAQTPINEDKWPECSAIGEAEWMREFLDRDIWPVERQNHTEEREYFYSLGEAVRYRQDIHGRVTLCHMLHVPETQELWSGVVARNLTLRNGSVDATIDLDVPTEFL